MAYLVIHVRSSFSSTNTRALLIDHVFENPHYYESSLHFFIDRY